MVTYHPTFKSVTGGFIPMVTMRRPNGQMIGCRVRREVCPTPALAESLAYVAAFRAVDALPFGIAKVAE